MVGESERRKVGLKISSWAFHNGWTLLLFKLITKILRKHIFCCNVQETLLTQIKELWWTLNRRANAKFLVVCVATRKSFLKLNYTKADTSKQNIFKVIFVWSKSFDFLARSLKWYLHLSNFPKSLTLVKKDFIFDIWQAL